MYHFSVVLEVKHILYSSSIPEVVLLGIEGFVELRGADASFDFMDFDLVSLLTANMETLITFKVELIIHKMYESQEFFCHFLTYFMLRLNANKLFENTERPSTTFLKNQLKYIYDFLLPKMNL